MTVVTGLSVTWAMEAIRSRAMAGVMWVSTTVTSSSFTTTIELLLKMGAVVCTK